MSNHYHLLIETASPTLSKGMKYLNGTYTQSYNHSHRRVGHVFQGRFKAILVESDAYLLELARYIVLNPVRARMVRSARDWFWSSYRGTAGLAKTASCLTTDWILAGFGRNRKLATDRYRAFVQAGRNQPSPWEFLKNQIYPGSDQFVEKMQCRINPEQSLADTPKLQMQSPPKPLLYYQDAYDDRNQAMAVAYRSGRYTLEQVGQQFGVSYATVSRAVKWYEKSVKCKA